MIITKQSKIDKNKRLIVRGKGLGGSVKYLREIKNCEINGMYSVGNRANNDVISLMMKVVKKYKLPVINNY